jgi:hypothetical protein
MYIKTYNSKDSRHVLILSLASLVAELSALFFIFHKTKVADNVRARAAIWQQKRSSLILNVTHKKATVTKG